MTRILLTCGLLIFAGMAFGQSQRSTAGSDNYLSFLLTNKSLPFDTISLPEFRDEVDDMAWKNWRIVENYFFGKDRGSLPMIADLNSLHPYFRDQIIQLLNACKSQGIELEIVEAFRTHAKQGEYFGMGRKYTRSLGGQSKHQYGVAIDVVPMVDDVPQWDNQHLWKKIGMIGEKLGLRWGGRWRAPYDPAHFEWSGGISTYQLSGGVQPFIPKTKMHLYPCINEEVERLQKSYSAWEIEQALISRNQQKNVSKVILGSVGQ